MIADLGSFCACRLTNGPSYFFIAPIAGRQNIGTRYPSIHISSPFRIAHNAAGSALRQGKKSQKF
tara:strand:+ start:395 stop:589 length:195 start_codon:yes stop_codon:yes gene_type:complete